MRLLFKSNYFDLQFSRLRKVIVERKFALFTHSTFLHNVLKNDGSGLLRIIISVWRAGWAGWGPGTVGGGGGWISFSSLEELDFSLGPGWTSLGHLNKSTRHS